MSLFDALLRGGWLRAVDHELALTLRRLRPETHELVLAGAALASRALAFGHGGVPLARVEALFSEIDAAREAPALPPLSVWLDALRASAWTQGPESPLVLDGERLYLRRYHDYETRLAAALLARVAVSQGDLFAIAPSGASSSPQADLFAAAPHDDPRLRELFDDPADPQAQAARAFRDASLLLLTGGPGTGKTTTVARALLLRIEAALQAGRAPPRIVLAAPTGKAAARLAEAVRETVAALRGTIDPQVAAAMPAQAATLHRLLGWRSDSVQFRHDAQHPLPADAVVVDEASMVDLPLMCKLVEAVAPEAALLLVGDRDQLPSVETGDVLAALCDAADAGGPLAAHRVALLRSRRQREGLDVARLAAWVRDGDADAALAALRADSNGGLAGIDWLPARERSPFAAIQSRVLPAFRAVQSARDPREGLALARRARVITALREGAAGSVALNAQIAQALHPAVARGERFFHGALVIVSENSYRHGLFNGDTGLCWRDADGTLRVWFEREGEDGLRAWPPAALPAHEPAFALTVHKSQGSEFDDVVLVLPPGGRHRALSRELLYTGLTRARRLLALWADEAALRAAIERRAQRWSGLAERLTGS